jgi:hypothetical protein
MNCSKLKVEHVHDTDLVMYGLITLFLLYIRLQLAEDMMQTSVALMKLCQPSNSYFRLLAAATLGTFYKITEKPKECIIILKNVVDNVGMYITLCVAIGPKDNCNYITPPFF